MPRRRSQRTEQRLLDAAADLFLRYGVAKTSMDEIARAAGVSKATLYRYWPSKDALFETLFFRELRAVNDEFLARLETDPLGGSIGSIVRCAYEATYARPFLRALMTTESRTLGQYLRQRSEFFSQWQFRIDRPLVEELQKVGVLRRDLDPGVLTYILTVISLGLMSAGEYVLPEFAPPSDMVIKALAETVERAVGAPEGGDREATKAILRRAIAEVNESLLDLEQQSRQRWEAER